MSEGHQVKVHLLVVRLILQPHGCFTGLLCCDFTKGSAIHGAIEIHEKLLKVNQKT